MMKRYILALGAASALVLAGVAGAGQQLTSAQMDGITAGGDATGTALAAAYGLLTSITYSVNTQSAANGVYTGQLGGIYGVQADSDSGSAATAQGGPAGPGTAFAGGASAGTTIGTGLSATDNNTTATASMLQDLTATPILLPFAQASAGGTGTATSTIVNSFASSVGASTAAATLGN
jgi:hypothetical protein